MPIFEYRCQECGRISEIFVNKADDGHIICSYCGSEKVERLISASHMLQTGTGVSGRTCCGRGERCAAPPCSTGDTCSRRLSGQD